MVHNHEIGCQSVERQTDTDYPQQTFTEASHFRLPHCLLMALPSFLREHTHQYST